MGRCACSHGQQQAGSLQEEGLPVLGVCPLSGVPCSLKSPHSVQGLETSFWPVNVIHLAPTPLRLSPTDPFPRKGRFGGTPGIYSPGQLAGARMFL